MEIRNNKNLLLESLHLKAVFGSMVLKSSAAAVLVLSQRLRIPLQIIMPLLEKYVIMIVAHEISRMPSFVKM